MIPWSDIVMAFGLALLIVVPPLVVWELLFPSRK